MNFRCMDCNRKRKLEDMKQAVAAGIVTYCRAPSCGGTMKPDITFFGENLPEPFFKAIKQDVSRCDLVIVIGTSLKVGGSVHLLLKHVEDRVPQVVIFLFFTVLLPSLISISSLITFPFFFSLFFTIFNCFIRF